MNEELKFKLKDVELRANIAGLKTEAAEEEATTTKAEANRLQRNADIVLQDLEQHIFPLIDQGTELLRRYEVEDIPGLESRIQKIRDEKKIEIDAGEKESRKNQTELQNEIQRLQNELDAKQVEFSKALDELKRAQDQLKTQGEGAAKTQAELEAAQKLLEVWVYT